METNKKAPPYFSLSEGGILFNALGGKRLINYPVKLVIAVLCVTWIPLLIITVLEGTFYRGVDLPFLEDVAMHVRLLIAFPLLLIIRLVIDSKVMDMEKYFSGTLMNDPEQQVILHKALRNARKLTGSSIIEIILLLIVIAVTINYGAGGLWHERHDAEGSWMGYQQEEKNMLTLAGKWAGYFSIPLYQFLMLRWLWKYIVWTGLLLRFSATRMNLQPTHPDRAGGLGVLLHVQKYFSIFFIAINIVASGELITQLVRDPGSFPSIRNEGIGYIIICLLLLLLPLIFFFPKLIRTKHQGLLKLSDLGATMGSRFEKEWINDDTLDRKVKDSLVSTSTLQDYATIYRSTEQMRLLPFMVKDIIFIAFLLFIPYIPILFIHFSLGELMQRLIGLLK